jgi:hypothetical protein
VPAAAAVVNALCDALGAEDLSMPAAPAVIWSALSRRRQAARYACDAGIDRYRRSSVSLTGLSVIS